jgi:hypothetical protein
VHFLLIGLQGARTARLTVIALTPALFAASANEEVTSLLAFLMVNVMHTISHRNLKTTQCTPFDQLP